MTNHANRMELVISSLANAGDIDLAGNDMASSTMPTHPPARDIGGGDWRNLTITLTAALGAEPPNVYLARPQRLRIPLISPLIEELQG